MVSWNIMFCKGHVWRQSNLFFHDHRWNPSFYFQVCMMRCTLCNSQSLEHILIWQAIYHVEISLFLFMIFSFFSCFSFANLSISLLNVFKIYGNLKNHHCQKWASYKRQTRLKLKQCSVLTSDGKTKLAQFRSKPWPTLACLHKNYPISTNHLDRSVSIKKLSNINKLPFCLWNHQASEHKNRIGK